MLPITYVVLICLVISYLSTNGVDGFSFKSLSLHTKINPIRHYNFKSSAAKKDDKAVEVASEYWQGEWVSESRVRCLYYQLHYYDTNEFSDIGRCVRIADMSTTKILMVVACISSSRRRDSSVHSAALPVGAMRRRWAISGE